ncbi:hypothetical protein D3C76_1882630 [compost metagenome]
MSARRRAEQHIHRIHGRLQTALQYRNGSLDLRQLTLGLTHLILRGQTLAVKQPNLL